MAFRRREKVWTRDEVLAHLTIIKGFVKVQSDPNWWPSNHRAVAVHKMYEYQQLELAFSRIESGADIRATMQGLIDQLRNRTTNNFIDEYQLVVDNQSKEVYPAME